MMQSIPKLYYQKNTRAVVLEFEDTNLENESTLVVTPPSVEQTSAAHAIFRKQMAARISTRR